MVKLYVYKVTFKEPPVAGEPQTEFYFTSLAAIFEVFTEKEIGCKVTRLWNLHIEEDKPYSGRRCTVEKKEMRRKPRNKANARR